VRFGKLLLNAQRILLIVLAGANLWEARVQFRHNSALALLYGAVLVLVIALLLATWPRHRG
jgi:hypothetical protein